MSEKRIGIREENKYKMERRVPITPLHAKKLIENCGLQIDVAHSQKRIFPDEEYMNAGCSIVKTLDDTPIIFGVKEIPLQDLRQNKVYVFFSHVIKGQPYNMPLLQKMIHLRSTLIDYEKIVDENNRRLIFFGRYAGLAGMINTLWSLGLRLQHLGVSNPFVNLRQTHTYSSLKEIEHVLKQIGEEIRQVGFPEELTPFTIGITGYGNVSNGAQYILDLLPVTEITPDELLTLSNKNHISNKTIYKILFKEKHISIRKDREKFVLEDFFTKPELFKSVFHNYIEHLTALVNCSYWDNRYDSLVTKKQLKYLYSNGKKKLKVIGDLSCDPNGGIEATHVGAKIEDPVFIYNPLEDKHSFGHKGDGVLIMAVDILPSELPKESSISFADALFDFVQPIASCDYNTSFEKIILPYPVKKALILLNGKLTPEYEYLKNYLDKENSAL
jgi:alpha-aminoadipic semialdehyde synthase